MGGKGEGGRGKWESGKTGQEMKWRRKGGGTDGGRDRGEIKEGCRRGEGGGGVGGGEGGESSISQRAI